MIRKVVKAFQEQNFTRPLDSDILIAVSGGADSLALSHLLLKYGRRVIPSEKLHFIHFDHSWGEHSKKVAQELEVYFQSYGKKLEVVRFKAPLKSKNSLENEARDLRKKEFRKRKKKFALILTAHQQDDLYETLLWRFFTGEYFKKPYGIFSLIEQEFRPFLQVSKREILSFLEEEGLKPWEDPSNQSTRFLRNQVRQEILPAVQRVFPHAKESILDVRNELKNATANQEDHQAFPVHILTHAAGLHLRRNQWLEIEKRMKPRSTKNKKLSIHLPEDWKLSFDSKEGWKLKKTT